jgi:predicted neuraminidase
MRFSRLFGAAFVLTSLAANVGKAGDPAIVLSEHLFTEKPTPECHASTIVETPTGLVAAWFAGKEEGTKDVGIWLARRDAKSWSKPLEIFNGVQADGSRHPCWNPVLFQQPGGPLHLFFKVGPRPSSWWGMHATSEDGGKTWGKAVRLPGKVLGPVRNKPVLLPDGVLLCGSSTEEPSLGWRVFMERTPDWGKTWEQVGPLNERDFGSIQPTILRWGPGKLQILCRTRNAKTIAESWSTDEGKSWPQLKPTALPHPGSGIDAVMLADGRGVLVYNHTTKGRSPLNVAVSSDGKTWFAGPVLENTPAREFSYPAVIQTSDGMIHITYTDGRERIKHVVIDPAKMQTKPMEGSQPKE